MKWLYKTAQFLVGKSGASLAKSVSCQKFVWGLEMRRKGHLSLVEKPAENVLPEGGQMIIPLGVAQRSPSPKQNKAGNRSAEIASIEKEVQAMLDVVNASFLLLNAVPCGQMSPLDLQNLKEMFAEGLEVVCAYQFPVASLLKLALSPSELKRVKRICANLTYLEHRMPEALEFIEDGMQEAKRSPRKKAADKSGAKVSSANTKSKPKGLQLKVSLQGAKPAIWRRIQVPADCTLYELHCALQYFMGWKDCHLHSFTISGRDYTAEKPRASGKRTSQAKAKTKADGMLQLAALGIKKGTKFTYEYDFGDSWIHKIEVEDELTEDVDELICTGGKGACPPEDCGGISSYIRMLAIMKNPAHPEYEDIKDYLGEDFDPKEF